MKLLKLTGAVAVTATTFLGGVSVLADNDSGNRHATTDADIEFIAAEDDEYVVDPPLPGPDGEDGEDGGEIEIPPVGPEFGGALSIAYAPTLNFGRHEISNKDQSYSVIAEWHNLVDGDGEVIGETPYVSFAQVQDRRGTNAGWTLTASQSEFTAENTLNDEIKGARISFHNSFLRYAPGVDEQEPTIPNEEFILNTEAQPIMFAEEGKGAGTSDIVWGNTTELYAEHAELKEQLASGLINQAEFDELSKEIRNHDIKLNIPGTSVVDAAAYNATVFWDLTAGYENK